MTTGRTRLEVILELKDKFSAKLKKSGKGLDGFSKTLKSVRGPLLAISAGLIGVGAVATKAFFSFDTELQRIVGLVGVAQSEVDEMRKGVLALSGATAIAPTELASALFAVTSAGQRGDQAMQTLKVSAQAAAAGMGGTKSVALALVGALQSYGAAGLNAADATDILVATVRAGNLEADTLASQLARIVPIAADAGVNLEQLGGAIALITRTGASTAETVTGLRAAIVAINAPTTEALTTFEEMGVTAQDLQTALAEKGLVAALRLVRGAAGDNETVFRKMIGSIEGVTAANVLISASNEDLEQTFGQVADAAGVTEEAFQVAADTAEFQFRQAIVDLKIAFVEMGAVVAPILVDITSKMAGLAQVFANLPDLTQKTAIGFGAIVAAFALIGLALPPIIAGFTLLTGELALFAATAAAAVAVGFLLGATVEGIVNGIKKITTDPGSKAAINPIAILKNEMQFLRDSILGVTDALSADELRAEALRAPFLAAAKEVEKLAKGIDGVTGAAKEMGRITVDEIGATTDAFRTLFEFLETQGARNLQVILAQASAEEDRFRSALAFAEDLILADQAERDAFLEIERQKADAAIRLQESIQRGVQSTTDFQIAEAKRLEDAFNKQAAAVAALPGITGGFRPGVSGILAAGVAGGGLAPSVLAAIGIGAAPPTFAGGPPAIPAQFLVQVNIGGEELDGPIAASITRLQRTGALAEQNP